MYDIEICLPITFSQEKYKLMFSQFKKYGLLRTNERKILLSLLVGTEKVPKDFNEGWGNGISVQLIRSKYNVLAQKTMDYYCSVINPKSAKWFMKLDDDSITDIKCLMEHLDKLNHNEERYLGSSLSSNIEDAEKEILFNMDEEHLYNPVHKIWHEWECCIMSSYTIDKILNCEKSMNFLNLRLKNDFPSSNDISLGIAAKFAGQRVEEADFLTNKPFYGLFSLFGGPICHLHYCSEIFDPTIFKEIDNKLINQYSEETRLSFSGEYCFFRYTKDGKNQHLFNIELNKTGQIYRKNHLNNIIGNPKRCSNEWLWTYSDKYIKFYNLIGKVSTIFLLRNIVETELDKYIIGDIVGDQESKKHILVKKPESMNNFTLKSYHPIF